jgi:hypothetical protein
LILDETDVIVPEWRLKKLTESLRLRPFLSHSKLRGIIREIDGAVSHRKKAMLRKRMKNDVDFQAFVDDLLKEMGYMNEEGQLDIQQERHVQEQ